MGGGEIKRQNEKNSKFHGKNNKNNNYGVLIKNFINDFFSTFLEYKNFI